MDVTIAVIYMGMVGKKIRPHPFLPLEDFGVDGSRQNVLHRKNSEESKMDLH